MCADMPVVRTPLAPPSQQGPSQSMQQAWSAAKQDLNAQWLELLLDMGSASGLYLSTANSRTWMNTDCGLYQSLLHRPYNHTFAFGSDGMNSHVSWLCVHFNLTRPSWRIFWQSMRMDLCLWPLPITKASHGWHDMLNCQNCFRPCRPLCARPICSPRSSGRNVSLHLCHCHLWFSLEKMVLSRLHQLVTSCSWVPCFF